MDFVRGGGKIFKTFFYASAAPPRWVAKRPILANFQGTRGLSRGISKNLPRRTKNLKKSKTSEMISETPHIFAVAIFAALSGVSARRPQFWAKSRFRCCSCQPPFCPKIPNLWSLTLRKLQADRLANSSQPTSRCQKCWIK